jgi:hypothetical protein
VQLHNAWRSAILVVQENEIAYLNSFSAIQEDERSLSNPQTKNVTILLGTL